MGRRVGAICSMVAFVACLLATFAALRVVAPSLAGGALFLSGTALVGIAIALIDEGVVLTFAARTLGMIVGFVQRPKQGLMAVSPNWWRGVFAVDIAASPDLLPWRSEQDEEHLGLRWRRVVVLRTYVRGAFGDLWPRFDERRVSSFAGAALSLLLLVSRLGCVLTVAVVAASIRISVKATAIVWLPLLWALKPPKLKADPWVAHLKLLARGDFTRLVVGFSALTLLLMLGKYVLLWAGHDLAVKGAAGLPWVGGRLSEFLDAFIRPGEVPIWQVSAAVNAVLAITAWLLARHWLLRAESGLAINEPGIDRTLAWMLGVRRVLTSYAIVCNFYAAWHLAQKMPLPSIGSKLFPWL